MFIRVHCGPALDVPVNKGTSDSNLFSKSTYQKNLDTMRYLKQWVLENCLL